MAKNPSAYLLLMPLAMKHPSIFIDLSVRAVPGCKQRNLLSQTLQQLADWGQSSFQSLRPHRLFVLIALECSRLPKGQSNITNLY